MRPPYFWTWIAINSISGTRGLVFGFTYSWQSGAQLESDNQRNAASLHWRTGHGEYTEHIVVAALAIVEHLLAGTPDLVGPNVQQWRGGSTADEDEHNDDGSGPANTVQHDHFSSVSINGPAATKSRNTRSPESHYFMEINLIACKGPRTLRKLIIQSIRRPEVTIR